MNKRQKGQRTTAKARKYWEELDYSVYTFPHMRFQKDAFGLFDMLVIPQIPFKRPALVQIKTNKMPSQKPFKEFKNNHWGIDVVIMIWFDRKGWRIIEV